MANYINFTPSVNQQGVARTTVVSFTVLEGATGAQINTLGVTIDGYQAILNGVFVGGYNGNIYPSAGKYVVGVYPKKPDFLRSAAKIDVHMELLDAYNSLDSYDYSFYTAGYNAPPPEPIPSEPTRACLRGFPFYPPTDLGLTAALDEGTGTEVALEWKQAHPFDEDNVVFYNIYYDTRRENVFDGYPDFLVTDVGATVGGLAPGDTHFFGLRAAEFDPLIFTTSGMSMAGPDMFFYPSDSMIDGYVGPTSMIVTANDTDGFPSSGILIVDTELIRYSSLSHSPVGFVVHPSGRGYAGTTAAGHHNNTRITMYPGREETNTIIAQATPSFQKPNYALTYVLGDGYGPDGYRDGYDGYAYHDGYLMYKQEPVNSLTTDGKNNDASGDFPRFDYCGTWRAMSPQSFMQGQCRQSYFGGAQVRIDEDGYRHLVKVPNTKVHMLQREELLLESTGEPFVLLRRMWTGIRCTCFMMRREHPDARCPVCFSTGFVQGYVQFFNPRRSDRRILVRIDPATDDLNIVDRGGLEPMYEPDGWTLPFPQVKDRDILIRFNPDNTEAWRYEVLHVTRNRVLFTQTGAQKMKIKRMPKTDIIYQYPVVRDTSPTPGSIITSVSSAPGLVPHTHEIIVPDGANMLTLKGATLESEGHNHIIYNGKVQSVLNHTHILV